MSDRPAAGQPLATHPPPYALRPALIGDLDLTYAITVDAMRDYSLQAWGVWDDAEQREKHRRNFTLSTHRIASCRGSTAGLLAVEEHPDHLWLVKLYLLRSHRQQGLGTLLLQQVIHEAALLGKPVRLRVLRVNDAAQRLYFRHGFTVADEAADRLFLVRGERAPSLTVVNHG
ncbi:MAG: GNAT family N-acetyltransferase [Rubrivivax sp.]